MGTLMDVSPDTLDVWFARIEKHFSREDAGRITLVEILRQIAFDPAVPDRIRTETCQALAALH